MIASIAIVGHREEIVEYTISGKLKFILVLFCVLIVSLVTLQLILANYLATQGEKISSLEHKISEIDLANRAIKSQIAQAGSLALVLKKAKDQGLDKQKNFFFVRESFALSHKNQ